MVNTPSPKPEPGPSSGTADEPFKRGQITWSRPPQQMFRVGLPPRAPVPTSPMAQRQGGMQTSRPSTGGGILSGSMIPKAAPASTPVAPPILGAVPAPAPAPATLSTPSPELAPRPVPLPVASPAETVRADREFVHPDRVSTEPAEVAPAVRPETTVPSYAAPSYAAAARPRAGVPTAVWIGGAAVALVLAAGAGWWMLKSDAPVPATVPAPSTPPEALGVSAAIAPVEAVAITEPAVAAADTETTPTLARPVTPAVAPSSATASTTSGARVAATSPASSPTPRLNTEATVPRIETAPLVVAPAPPAPTAAETPPTDADAPIRTRPQPLN